MCLCKSHWNQDLLIWNLLETPVRFSVLFSYKSLFLFENEMPITLIKQTKCY